MRKGNLPKRPTSRLLTRLLVKELVKTPQTTPEGSGEEETEGQRFIAEMDAKVKEQEHSLREAMSKDFADMLHKEISALATSMQLGNKQVIETIRTLQQRIEDVETELRVEIERVEEDYNKKL